MRSVYIHIPFCKKICTYCDFPKQIYNKNWSLEYLEALSKEIEKYYEDDEVKSIYIGGGTPSVLDIEGLTILFKIIKVFKKNSDTEFTFEMNIDDVTEEKLLFLKANGVNRVSLGIQSFNKKNQEFLGRNHEKKDILEKITLIKRIGIDNINVDLMYALPNESILDLRRDLSLFKKLDVPHISTYSLIIEDHTIIKIKGIKNISEDIDAKMYDVIRKNLSKNGYIHYEVSNFAKKGFESKHNLTYWDNNEYYGFGLGAAGYLNDLRYENTRSFQEYIEYDFRKEEIFLSKKDDMDNEIMLGLRKLDGINLKEFYDKYDINIQEAYQLEDLVKDGLLVLKGENIAIPEDKIYVMNEILTKIIK